MPLKLKEYIGLNISVKNTLFTEYCEGIRIKSYRLRIYRSDEVIGESFNERAQFTKKNTAISRKSKRRYTLILKK